MVLRSGVYKGMRSVAAAVLCCFRLSRTLWAALLYTALDGCCIPDSILLRLTAL
jgi:hypothetical protein